MPIVKEVEKVIGQLPPEQASSLKNWLNEFKAARRYKQIKWCAVTAKALVDFEKGKSNALWN